MNKKEGKFIVLLADDDDDDYLLINDAFKESSTDVNLYWLRDGEETMAYLSRKGKYSDTARSPLPDLVILDLNMPKKDGREVLKEIKSDPAIRFIPVVILTTSASIEDINLCYDLGANSYIKKPMGFNSFLQTIDYLCKYWFKTVMLPIER